MQLTEHFTYEEMTVTSLEKYKAQNYQEGLAVINTLTKLCHDLMEPIRVKFGLVVVHSGFRCAELNNAVGSHPTSQHLIGEACDFNVDGVADEVIFEWIWKESGLKFHQLILEVSGSAQWVHVALAKDVNDGQVMKFDGQNYIHLEQG